MHCNGINAIGRREFCVCVCVGPQGGGSKKKVTPLATASSNLYSLKSNVRSIFKNKAKIELSPTPSIVKTFRYAADVPAWCPARPKDLPKHAGEEAPLACRDLRLGSITTIYL